MASQASGDPSGGAPSGGDRDDTAAGGSSSGKRATGKHQPPGRKQKGPFVDQCEAGKYAWCQCGTSGRYPYCDGSHRGSEVTPLKVTLDKPCCVVWCACGASANKPFCDGSHTRL